MKAMFLFRPLSHPESQNTGDSEAVHSDRAGAALRGFSVEALVWFGQGVVDHLCSCFSIEREEGVMLREPLLEVSAVPTSLTGPIPLSSFFDDR